MISTRSDENGIDVGQMGRLMISCSGAKGVTRTGNGANRLAEGATRDTARTDLGKGSLRHIP